MNKTRKLEKAMQLIEEGRKQVGKRKRSGDAEFIKWRADAQTFLERVGARCVSEFAKVSFSLSAFTTSTPDSRFQDAYDNGVRRAVALVESTRDEIQDYEADDVDAVASVPRAVDDILTLCRRFPKAARQLQTRHAGRKGIVQKDEYDAQDVLHSLLLLRFDDVRPEEWTPSYAGSSARMDFLLPDEGIVIEVKRTREKLEAKRAKEELAVDVDHYRKHDRCKTLVCFVFDPDHRIANPVGFEKDLEGQRTENLNVRVVVAPHG